MRSEPAWSVPAFSVTAYTPRSARYGLLVPVLNEGDRIRSQLERMKPWMDRIDAVLVDGGSTDGSPEEECLRSAGFRALLVKTGPGGLDAQLRVGLAWLLREGYEGVVLMDGNNKDDPAGIDGFVAALEDGADHVQGSRYLPGGRHEHTPMLRHLGVRCVHAPLLSAACGFRYTDTTNGFRAYSRRFLEDPRVQPFRDVFQGYALHYYLAVRAAQLGFKVREIPVTRCYPPGSAVPTKIKGLSGYGKVLGALFNACLHRYDPPRPENPA